MAVEYSGALRGRTLSDGFGPPQMKNQVEIPVSEELKERYIASLPMIDFKVARAFDPVRAYKYLAVPDNMTFETFVKIVAKDFQIDDLGCILLDMAGNQVPRQHTVSDLRRRFGAEFQIAQYHSAVQYFRE